MVKECIDEILPLITEIINTSLELGEMPSELKHAIIKPLLKKAGLALEEKNYRPVSNLSYISKLIEDVVVSQFTGHLEDNNINDIKQSAHKKVHSTLYGDVIIKSKERYTYENGQR